MHAVEALTRLGGTGDSTAILGLTSRERLRSAVRRGEVEQVSRNRYRLPTATRAATAAARLHGVVSHLSAAAYHGWEIKFPPEEPHVSVRRDRKVAPERRVGVHLHWTALADEDVAEGVTGKLRTVIDCAKHLPFDEALAVADSALRHGDVARDDLLDAAEALRGRNAARARRVAAYADRRAANPFESVLRALAIDAGFDVVPQYEIEVDGKLIHPDLVDPIRGIALEADSWTWHRTKEAHERDCWRYTALVVTGWTVVRFTWQQVMLSPAYVAWALSELQAPPPQPGNVPETRRVAA